MFLQENLTSITWVDLVQSFPKVDLVQPFPKVDLGSYKRTNSDYLGGFGSTFPKG